METLDSMIKSNKILKNKSAINKSDEVQHLLLIGAFPLSQLMQPRSLQF